jgi:hypothetical protein
LPDDRADHKIWRRANWFRRARWHKRPTIPSLLGAEKKENVFRVPTMPAIAAAVGLSHSPAEVFAGCRRAEQILIHSVGRVFQGTDVPHS